MVCESRLLFILLSGHNKKVESTPTIYDSQSMLQLKTFKEGISNQLLTNFTLTYTTCTYTHMYDNTLMKYAKVRTYNNNNSIADQFTLVSRDAVHEQLLTSGYENIIAILLICITETYYISSLCSCKSHLTNGKLYKFDKST